MTHTFRVWAPEADKVDVAIDSRIVAMRRTCGGWWCHEDGDARHGTRYSYSVDGGPLRPDPRSAFQPDGVDGPSEVVDHDQFAWGDSAWTGRPLGGTILYELHVGTFTSDGTFDAAVGRLDHLVRLGVDAVELMPVADFAGSRGWGYDGVDLFAPHHAYGGPDGLKRLVDACHSLGLGVVVDVVYNHLGPAGNHLQEFGPYFTEQHKTNWGNALNFDGSGSGEVRRFVIDNAIMWLRDYHCDGLRIDATHAIVDTSACHILEQLASEILAAGCHLRRPVFLIAESDLNDPRLVRRPEGGGYGLDASWADDWHHALHAYLTGEHDGYYADYGSLESLAKALRQGWVYDGQWSERRQRVQGRSVAGLSGHQFVAFTQNHDQIGNRALGERLSELTTTGRLKAAAALLLTSPFTVMLFQGEEWGAATPFQYFTDYPDPKLGEAVSHGRRREFASWGWDPATVPDPQDPLTHLRSRLDWSELADPIHLDLLDWYRQLIVLRRSRPDLSDPRLQLVGVSVDEGAGIIALERGRIIIVANLGPGCVTFTVPVRSQVVLASSPQIYWSEGAVTVPADGVVIVQRPEMLA